MNQNKQQSFIVTDLSPSVFPFLLCNVSRNHLSFQIRPIHSHKMAFLY